MTTAPDRPGEARPLAVPLHTVVLLVALLALSIGGAVTSPMAGWTRTLAGPGARTALYVRIVLIQWLWVAYVWFGMRRSGVSLGALAEPSGWKVSRGLRQLGIGLAACIAWMAISGALAAIARPTPEQLAGLRAMLPHTLGERAWWSGFAVSAGLCEEVVYRGYLLRQFRALTHSAAAALVLQAAAYAVAHLVLPAPMVASVALLGVYLGALALWQKSLVPGMIAHVGIGLAAVATPG